MSRMYRNQSNTLKLSLSGLRVALVFITILMAFTFFGRVMSTISIVEKERKKVVDTYPQ